MPETPDGSDDDCGTYEGLALHLVQQVAPPANLFAKTHKGIDSGPRQHAGENRDDRNGHGWYPQLATGVLQPHGVERVVLGSANPVGEEEDEEGDGEYEEPSGKPPAVDLPADPQSP